jgi:malonate decarboxylase epsilon subunit
VSAALLFPGQGSQTPGFLQRLSGHPALRSTIDEAAAVLGMDVSSLDSAEALTSTVAVQIGLLVAGVAMMRTLLAASFEFEAAAGLSIGAFGAAVACEALSFADALMLVRLRAERMQAAYPTGYGMAAVLGLDEREVSSLVARLGGAAAELYIANVNAPAQIVVAGASGSLGALLTAARAAGARQAERMAVSVPSHCALLDSVADALAVAMDRVEVRAPVRIYVSNRGARVVRDAQGVRDDLIHNVAHTVRWHDSVSVLRELGVRLFIEMPPGQVLSRLVRQAFADARAVAIEDTSIASVLQLATGYRSQSPSA